MVSLQIFIWVFFITTKKALDFPITSQIWMGHVFWGTLWLTFVLKSTRKGQVDFV